MKKQVVAIVGILAATAIMIYLAALYGNRNRFDYLKDLDKTVFTLDGTDYQLRDMTYYIARQEKEMKSRQWSMIQMIQMPIGDCIPMENLYG